MISGPKPKPGTTLNMANYRISTRAKYDLAAIADYTLENFGKTQSRRYSDGLKLSFQNLSQHRHLGRKADDLADALRAFDYSSHVIYYLLTDKDILIVRVLH
ncbi:MAG: hypothetical protein B7Z26_06265 [Asticcacaulis sp. 32-58-5]|nr:MAG: hypothetical protein B7Z26_06265 [Asticcacaulis sp. 32-58-5]